MANEKVARFVLPSSSLSSLATAATAGDVCEHKARLVHIVGMPVHTSAGWRLRVEGSGRRDATSSPASPRREGLVAPTNLVTDNAGVIVLQAPPIAVGAEPFVADREGWFAFAVDILEAGAASVLTVPPLGDVKAEQAVDITTNWALRTPDDLQPRNVVRLLKDLSKLVAEVSAADDGRVRRTTSWDSSGLLTRETAGALWPDASEYVPYRTRRACALPLPSEGPRVRNVTDAPTSSDSSLGTAQPTSSQSCCHQHALARRRGDLQVAAPSAQPGSAPEGPLRRRSRPGRSHRRRPK